jgi:hypothetical protein
VGRVAGRLAPGGRFAAQLGEAGGHERHVDRAAHRRAHPHVAVGAGGPGHPDRQLDDLTGQARDRVRDLALGRLVLVAEHHPTHPVGDRLAHPGGADRVERVHRRDQPELRPSPDRAQPRHRDLALGEHGDQDVERLLRNPVELLEVEQPTLPHRGEQRPVHEARRAVALGEHLSRVELPHQPGGRQFGVSFDEQDGAPVLPRDRAQQRRLTGAGRTLDDHVPAGRERDGEYLALATETDNSWFSR